MKILNLVLVVALICVGSLSAEKCFASGFSKKHPRRAQVNRREKRQQNRIANGIKSGKINSQEAAQLEGKEAAIKSQERSEVKADGGHLTRGEQKQLNRELNQESSAINQDKHN